MTERINLIGYAAKRVTIGFVAGRSVLRELNGANMFFGGQADWALETPVQDKSMPRQYPGPDLPQQAEPTQPQAIDIRQGEQ